MAYECRNNLAPTYFPKGSDVWSLGIVLLNLLFHRCPWGDPTDDDQDFYEFHLNPVAFLLDRFQGIGREVAQYLADNVLNCEGARVSPGKFGEWASNLVYMMSDPRPAQPRKTSVSDAALPLVASHRSADFRRFSHVLPSPSGSSRAVPRSSLLSQALNDPAHSPSPVSSPLPLEGSDELTDKFESRLKINTACNDTSPLNYVPVLSAGTGSRLKPSFPLETIPGSLPDQDPLSEEMAQSATTPDSDAQALAAKAKRRKRGARRGRSAARAEASEARDNESRARSPRNSSHEHRSSQSQRKPNGSSRHRPPMPSQTASDQSARPATASKPPGSSGNSGFAGRFKGAFKNGNSDLEMFMQRAREREAALSGNSATNSAPAKLQQGSSSHIVSFGTNSAQSTASWGSGDDDSRAHWSSTAARRERLRGHKAFSETSSFTSASAAPSRMSSFSSEPTTISEATTPSSPPYRSPVRADADRTAKQTTTSLSRIDEQLRPLRERPEPAVQQQQTLQTKPASQPPPPAKAKSGFFKGLFR